MVISFPPSQSHTISQRAIVESPDATRETANPDLPVLTCTSAGGFLLYIGVVPEIIIQYPQQTGSRTTISLSLLEQSGQAHTVCGQSNLTLPSHKQPTPYDFDTEFSSFSKRKKRSHLVAIRGSCRNHLSIMESQPKKGVEQNLISLEPLNPD
jgi:hypothetical protein